MMATTAPSSDPTAWKIVTMRNKGLTKMRTMCPSNPFTVLTEDFGFKKLTGDDDDIVMEEVGLSKTTLYEEG